MALIHVTPYVPTATENTYLASLIPFREANWDLNNNNIKVIKDNLRQHLLQAQDSKCCYCSGDLQETSQLEIDHIAPKSLHGEFTLEMYNLVLACEFCNGFQKKSYTETIVAPKNTTYRSNNFSIVHPIIDGPNGHIKIIKRYVVVGVSQKGKNSIALFDLTNERQERMRRKNYIFGKIEGLEAIIRQIVPGFKGLF